MKLRQRDTMTKEQIVAPYVGAWIETEDIAVMAKVILVAPYVGAWIETWKSAV